MIYNLDNQEERNLYAMSVEEKLNLFPKLVTILKDIQDDVKDYQTENGIGMMDDIQWQQLLVERIIASVESFNYNLK
jgi:hypothetical protein